MMKYLLLKKNRTKNLDSCRIKEVFKADFAELFDLSTKDVHSCMKNKDKIFLIMQQEDPSSCSMAVVDQSLGAKETRKRIREN